MGTIEDLKTLRVKLIAGAMESIGQPGGLIAALAVFQALEPARTSPAAVTFAPGAIQISGAGKDAAEIAEEMLATILERIAARQSTDRALVSMEIAGKEPRACPFQVEMGRRTVPRATRVDAGRTAGVNVTQFECKVVGNPLKIREYFRGFGAGWGDRLYTVRIALDGMEDVATGCTIDENAIVLATDRGDPSITIDMMPMRITFGGVDAETKPVVSYDASLLGGKVATLGEETVFHLPMDPLTVVAEGKTLGQFFDAPTTHGAAFSREAWLTARATILGMRLSPRYIVAPRSICSTAMIMFMEIEGVPIEGDVTATGESYRWANPLASSIDTRWHDALLSKPTRWHILTEDGRIFGFEP